MRLYDSMTNSRRELEVKDNTVRIYACGPTVYNYFHIGNGRAFSVYDTLRRYLEYKGYNVLFAQNFTDVDDKIINRAREEGISTVDVAEKYIKEYFRDADGLGIERATFHPRATENIQNIIDMVQTLVDKGHAYAVNGDVYFRVRSDPEYGKLFKQSIDDLEAGARISVSEQKEDKLDFALWKAAKPGEPSWASPWGEGRPGWHIECSAMAKHYLGDTIDIHCGGNDLKFPHHENEIAQSECANGCEFARLWFHVGFVNVNNEKMSKSKNNFFTVRDLASVYGYEPLRYFTISAHYRNPINYEPELIEQAKASLDRLRICKKNLEFLISSASDTVSADEKEASERFKGYVAAFEAAMDDDLNTANALSALFDFARDINTVTMNGSHSKAFLQSAKDTFVRLANVMGLLLKDDETDDELEKHVESLIAERREAKKAKNYARADEIRDQLKAEGIVIEDTANGTKWRKA